MSFSYQLYSSRNFPPLTNTIKLVGELGYSEVEGYGGLFGDMAAVKALKADLDANGLKMGSTHIGLDMVEDDIATALEIAKTLEIQSLYVPFIMPDDRPTSAAGWRDFGARLEAAGKPIVDAGYNFGYHNHDFEFVPTDGVIPMDALLEGGPSLQWEMDVAWVVRGEADPIAWVEKYKDRITAAHVKDLAPAGENADEDGWADVGHGRMDWAGIMAALRGTPAKHFVMEHDNPSDEKRFASRSITSANSF